MPTNWADERLYSGDHKELLQVDGLTVGKLVATVNRNKTQDRPTWATAVA